MYVVQPGDSCWSIASKVFGKSDAYKLVHEYNPDLGPHPHILKPGTTIKLPANLADPDAALVWLKEKVNVKAPAMMDWLRAVTSQGVWRLYKVATEEESLAGIRFRDLSNLSMRAESLLLIYGSATSKITTKRKLGTELKLEKGSIRGGLAAMDAAADMTVETPAAKVRLRATDSEVEVDRKTGTTRVAVYTGTAKVAAQGKTVEVKQGEGTVVEKRKPPAKPRPLLSGVSWESDIGDLMVPVLPFQQGAAALRWKSLPGAVRYRLTVAGDADFKNTTLIKELDEKTLEYAISGLKPGSYFANVSGRDSTGLWGKPSEKVELKVTRMNSSRALTPGPDAAFEMQGMIMLQPEQESAGRIEASVNDGPWQLTTTPIRLWKPGTYTIRTRLVGKTTVTQMKVKVLAVAASFEVPSEPLDLTAGPAEIGVGLKDERGRPASLPGLSVVATPGGELSLRCAGAGRFIATLPRGTAGQAIKLRASWVVGDLGQAEIPIKPPPPPPKPAAPVQPRVRSEWDLWAQRHLIELGLYAGAFFPSRDIALFDPELAQQAFASAAFSGGLRMSYMPLPYLGLEAEGGVVPTSTRDGQDALLYHARAHLVLQYPARLAAFLVLGAGVLGVDSGEDAVGKDMDASFTFGIGARIYITRWLTARVDGRMNLSSQMGEEGAQPHFEALAGAAYLWNWK